MTHPPAGVRALSDPHPRSIAELLDRAVTVSVRAFVPLATIAAIVTVPENALVLVPLGIPSAPGDAIRFLAIFLIVAVLLLLATVLQCIALTTAIDSANRRERVRVWHCYLAGLRRLRAGTLISLRYSPALLVFLIGLGLAGGLIGSRQPSMIATGLVVFVAAAIPGSMALFAWTIAFVHCALLGRYGGEFVGGIAVLQRRELGRTWRACLVPAAVSVFAYAAAFGLPALLKGVPGERWITAGVTTVVEVGISILTVAFSTLYYLDLRMRREGFDVPVAASTDHEAAGALTS